MILIYSAVTLSSQHSTEQHSSKQSKTATHPSIHIHQQSAKDAIKNVENNDDATFFSFPTSFSAQT